MNLNNGINPKLHPTIVRRILLSAHKALLESNHTGKNAYKVSNTLKEISSLIDELDIVIKGKNGS